MDDTKEEGFDLVMSEPGAMEEMAPPPREEFEPETPPEPEMPPEPPMPAAPMASMDEAVEVGEGDACSICGFPMEPEWRVCPNCVTTYETTCRSCGRKLQPWWLICPWCETKKPLEDFDAGGS
jgi:hypothetical protein